MRLTQILFKLKPEFQGYVPKFRGSVHIGKYRYVKRVTTWDKLHLWEKMKNEEQTMKYLSKPYITSEQEQAYLKSIGRTHHEYWDEFMRRPIVEPLNQTYAADFIKGFDISKKFEEED